MPMDLRRRKGPRMRKLTLPAVGPIRAGGIPALKAMLTRLSNGSSLRLLSWSSCRRGKRERRSIDCGRATKSMYTLRNPPPLSKLKPVMQVSTNYTAESFSASSTRPFSERSRFMSDSSRPLIVYWQSEARCRKPFKKLRTCSRCGYSKISRTKRTKQPSVPVVVFEAWERTTANPRPISTTLRIEETAILSVRDSYMLQNRMQRGSFHFFMVGD